MRLALLLAVGVGCSGGSRPVSPDASVPDAAIVPDAPPPEALTFTGCDPAVPLTTLALPDLRVGQTVAYTLAIGNRHVDPDAPTTVSVMGGSGLDAQLLATGVPTAKNIVKLLLTPTVAGSFSAVVTVRAGSTAEVQLGSITVTANVLAASTDPLVIDTVLGERFVLKNQSTSMPITIDAPRIVTDDGMPSYSGEVHACSHTLQPGDTCTISVEKLSSTLGCHRSTLTFHSSANTEVVQVEQRGIARVDVQATGGMVVATPPGSCDGSTYCSAPVVTLTAAPFAGNVFDGWVLPGCGTAPTCALRATPDTAVAGSARFAPATAKSVTITVQGPGAGAVLVYEDIEPPIVCEGTCTYAVKNPGAVVRLVAAERSSFAGWSGACAGTTQQCNLGVLTSNVTVGAMFVRSDRELATLAPPRYRVDDDTASSGGFLPGGDVVIAGRMVLSRMTAQNAVVWSKPAAAIDLVTTPSGDIFYLTLERTTLVLYRIDSSGSEVWSRVLYRPIDEVLCTGPRRLALMSNGDVAVTNAQTLGVYAAADGAERWTTPVAGCGTVAADHAGHVLVTSIVQSGTTVVKRYDAQGNPQLPDLTLTDNVIDLVVDPQDFLAVVKAGAADYTLSRLSTTGTEVFSITQTDPFRALTATSDGEIAVIDDPVQDSSPDLRIRRFSATGQLTWTLDKPAFTSSIATVGIMATTLVAGPAGGLLVLGTQAVRDGRAWAAIFAGP